MLLATPYLTPSMQTALATRCAPIQLLLMDVDGVLTGGDISYDYEGVELKSFNVRDGLGLKIWMQAGKSAGVMSGRTSRTVVVRAAEFGLDPVWQGLSDKRPALAETLQRRQLKPEQVCFIGDDLPDLPVMRQVGLAVAVADAFPDVAHLAHFVTTAPGGKGAVRETIEMILRSQGLWQKVVERYYQ